MLAQAVRDGGKADRAVEEARLQRRQKRQNPESAQASVRGSSAVPGTPGTVAPDLEPKTSAKKETKKGMTAARMADVSNTSTANATINQLMGSFGRGKKSKRYNWMTAGAGGGSQAPKAGASQELGNPNTSMQRAGDANSLTMDGKYRLGAFREDGEKGRYIQIRDWVTALELEGLDTKAMQLAYAKLDESAER